MKFAFALAALLCITFVPAHGDLITDMQRFIALIPVDEVTAIHDNFYDTDVDFQATEDFIHGPRCAELVATLDTVPAFRDYFAFLESKGIPGYYWLNKVREYFGWPAFVPEKYRSLVHALPNTKATSSRSYLDFINAVLGVIPTDEVLATWDDLMANSPEWRDMFALLQDPEYIAVRTALVEDPTYVEIDNEMIANGFDLTLYLETIWQFYVTAHNP